MQKAYNELLQERSAHGALREVDIDALTARLRLVHMYMYTYVYHMYHVYASVCVFVRILRVHVCCVV